MTKLLYLYSNVFLLGLIWTIQLVHYPSFLYIDKRRYNEFQQFHMRSISFIVMPIMLIELFSAIALSIYHFENMWFVLSFASLIFVWGWTFFINVPLHSKLVRSSSDELIKSLIRSNWPRTIAWTVKLAFTMLYVFNV